ncbi:uncharacterized protein BX664DRAFT_245291, partial [Halteromyces radiatus]|uniref:uncharacterized protein n=1 Tax=Halteromyces radiatus TaxID=101107 RepID=UPI0022206057
EDMQECKVWGVDPGVTEVFVAVDNSDPSERHQVRKFSSAEYYVKAGYKKTNNTICETKQSQNIDRLESSIPSPKTSSMDGIQLYIERLLDVLPLLVQFYGTEIQRLRFLNYIGKQKVQDERINIFVNGGKKYN